jgi:predicted permease
MTTLWQDIRFGLRMLARNPGFTAAAVLTLALGIGANGTIFSVANELFFRPVSGAGDLGRLAGLCFTENGRGCNGFSYPEYVDLRDRSRSFSALTAYRTTALNLSGGSAAAERVMGATVSGNYFTVLGVKMALGRSFLPEEDRTPGTHPVAMLSYALWKRRFAGDRGIVGSTVNLNGAAFTIVGVASKGFKGTELGDAVEIFVPTMMEKQARPLFEALDNRLFHVLHVAGRLAEGVRLEQAQAEMDVLGSQIAQASADKEHRRKQIQVFRDIRMDPEFRAYAWNYLALLLGITGLVLLIACANVANLMLARAAVRSREIAVRLALGAGRGRIVRQLLTEGMLLALLAGAAGLLLSDWAGRLLSSIDWGQDLDLRVDYRVLGFTMLLAALTALLSGLVPALQASRPELVQALKEGAAGSGSRGSVLRSLLVVTQMALSLVLLAGAGLLLQTFLILNATTPGFDANNIILAPIQLRAQGYSPAQARQFYGRLMERAGAIPGVEAVALAHSFPIGWTWGSNVIVEGHEPLPDQPQAAVDSNVITPGYFPLLKIPIVRGRDFTREDKDSALPVVIINEAMATRFWPGEDPTVKRLRLPKLFGPSPFLQVVGVVKDTHHRRLGEPHSPQIYLPYPQEEETEMTLLVRARQEPAGIVPSLRKALQELDPGLPLPEIITLRERVASSIADQRDNAILVGILGVLAVALAGIGLYAVMSYAVAQRSREIGIRMALGAQGVDVVRQVVGQGASLALAGIGIGVAAGLALTRLMAGLLYGVSATDWLTFASVAALLLLVALAACYLPARRATKVDPMVALRYE